MHCDHDHVWFSLAPTPPTKIKAIDIQANSITLEWINNHQKTTTTTTTYVKYRKVSKRGYSGGFYIVCGQSPFIINGLQSSTDYEFQIGAYSPMYGGSEWSVKNTARTSAAVKGNYTINNVYFWSSTFMMYFIHFIYDECLYVMYIYMYLQIWTEGLN